MKPTFWKSGSKTIGLSSTYCWVVLLAASLFLPGCSGDPSLHPYISPPSQPATTGGQNMAQPKSLSPEALDKMFSADTGQTNLPESVVLREGDSVNITFPSSASLNTTQQIRRDGRIVMPLIGEVVAAGKTPADLQSELIKLYAPQVATKQVIVTVQNSTFPVFVTGAVLRPGKVLADRPLTVLDAIMESGGFDYTKANLKAVEVVRQGASGTTKYKLDLKKAMAGGDEKPFYLQPSDIVFVPEKFTWF